MSEILTLLDRPTVRVVMHTMVTLDGRELVPPHHEDLETAVAIGGKVCYDAHGRDGRPVDRHVQRLADQQHGSVFEHATVSLLLTGISRGCSHELVRHRHMSFSQRSTRYTDEGECRIVLEPRVLALRDEQPEAFAIYLSGLTAAFASYRSLVGAFLALAPAELSDVERRKYARGAARQLLPHALETQIVVTANLRTWREFVVLRSHRSAEAEMRRLADAIYRRLTSYFDLRNALEHGLTTTTVDGFLEITPTTP
jgi:thymidylate synthase (FAD)